MITVGSTRTVLGQLRMSSPGFSPKRATVVFSCTYHLLWPVTGSRFGIRCARAARPAVIGPFLLRRMDMENFNPTLRALWSVVERNLGRCRRRYLRACQTPMENGDITLSNGEVVQVSSGDEPVLSEKGFPRTLPPLFDTAHNMKDPRYTAPMDATVPDARTPKTPGGPLNDPSSLIQGFRGTPGGQPPGVRPAVLGGQRIHVGRHAG